MLKQLKDVFYVNYLCFKKNLTNVFMVINMMITIKLKEVKVEQGDTNKGFLFIFTLSHSKKCLLLTS